MHPFVGKNLVTVSVTFVVLATVIWIIYKVSNLEIMVFMTMHADVSVVFLGLIHLGNGSEVTVVVRESQQSQFLA